MELVTDNGVGCDSAASRRARAELWSASPAQRCTRMCACVLPEDCAQLNDTARAVEIRRRDQFSPTLTHT